MHNKFLRLVFILIGVYLCLVACGVKKNGDILRNNTMQEFYTLSDFEWVTINQTTLDELHSKMPSPASAMATSYGILCVYPMENGHFIHVKITGKNMVISSISEIG